jgi:hypothetical protein
MHPDELLYPALFHEGHAYFLERSDARTGSYFGGPFEASITGIEHGPRPLHHIATLNGDCFERFGTSLVGAACGSFMACATAAAA